MLNITGIPKINYLSELRYFVILSWIQLRSFLFHSFTYMKQDFNVNLKNYASLQNECPFLFSGANFYKMVLFESLVDFAHKTIWA